MPSQSSLFANSAAAPRANGTIAHNYSAVGCATTQYNCAMAWYDRLNGGASGFVPSVTDGLPSQSSVLGDSAAAPCANGAIGHHWNAMGCVIARHACTMPWCDDALLFNGVVRLSTDSHGASLECNATCRPAPPQPMCCFPRDARP